MTYTSTRKKWMQVIVTFGHLDYKYANTQMHITFKTHKRIWVLGSFVVVDDCCKKLSSIAHMQTAQPHMRSLQFAFVNLHGPYHYPVFFASHTCFKQSEHLCRLVSKRAGRKKLSYIWAVSSLAFIFWAYEKETAIVTPAQSGLSLFWSETPEFEPRSGEIFSTVNGVPLHTAFHYHLFIVLIWLKYCWWTWNRKLSIYLGQK